MIVHLLSSCNNFRIRKIVYKEVFHLETDISIGGMLSFISYLSEFYHICKSLKPLLISSFFFQEARLVFLCHFLKCIWVVLVLQVLWSFSLDIVCVFTHFSEQCSFSLFSHLKQWITQKRRLTQGSKQWCVYP